MLGEQDSAEAVDPLRSRIGALRVPNMRSQLASTFDPAAFRTSSRGEGRALPPSPGRSTFEGGGGGYSAADKATLSRLDAKFCGLDAKLNDINGKQQRLERDMAKLDGRCSAQHQDLSDNLQPQIKRTNELDSRMYDWKQAIEEDYRAKFADLVGQLQEIQSASRKSNNAMEDLNKKVVARIGKVELAIQDLVERVDGQEQFQLQQGALHLSVEPAIKLGGGPLSPASPDTSEVERRAEMLSRMSLSIELLSQDTHDIKQDCHDLRMKITEYEERSNTMSKRIETSKETHDILRGKIDDVDSNHSQKHSENGKKLVEHHDRLSTCITKLDKVEKETIELGVLRETTRANRALPALPAFSGAGDGAADGREKATQAAQADRLQQLEAKVEGLAQVDLVGLVEQTRSRGAGAVALPVDIQATVLQPIGELVRGMQKISPKIQDMDTRIGELASAMYGPHTEALVDTPRGASGRSNASVLTDTPRTGVDVDGASTLLQKVREIEGRIDEMNAVIYGGATTNGSVGGTPRVDREAMPPQAAPQSPRGAAMSQSPGSLTQRSG